MAKQTELTVIILVLLTTTVEIQGENRYKAITKNGGVIYPSTESPTASPSPPESPLTMPLTAPLSAKSGYVLNNKGGAIQLEVTAGRAAP